MYNSYIIWFLVILNHLNLEDILCPFTVNLYDIDIYIYIYIYIYILYIINKY